MVRLADAARAVPSVARLLDSVEDDTMLRFRPPAGWAVGPAEYLGGGTPVKRCHALPPENNLRKEAVSSFVSLNYPSALYFRGEMYVYLNLPQSPWVA